MNQPIIEYSWPAYIDCLDKLTSSIQSSDFIPDIIIGLARGGLIPAQILGYKLNVSKVLSYGIASYSGKTLTNSYEEYQIPDTSILYNQRVLIVDDLIDKGGSFTKAIEKLSNNTAVCKTAAPLLKEESKFIPNFYVHKVPANMWIKLPWD